MGSNNRNPNIVIDENYSTLTNHSKTTVNNTLTSCNQLRKINIKEKMRKNYCIDIEDINTCILFNMTYRFISRKALKMAVLSLQYLRLNSGIFD
jgi:ribosomal protein L23